MVTNIIGRELFRNQIKIKEMPLLDHKKQEITKELGISRGQITIAEMPLLDLRKREISQEQIKIKKILLPDLKKRMVLRRLIRIQIRKQMNPQNCKGKIVSEI
jgi:hypothetical protein